LRGADGERALKELKACLNKNVFSLGLEIGRELESAMSAVSEFQTAGP